MSTSGTGRGREWCSVASNSSIPSHHKLVKRVGAGAAGEEQHRQGNEIAIHGLFSLSVCPRANYLQNTRGSICHCDSRDSQASRALLAYSSENFAVVGRVSDTLTGSRASLTV